MPPKLNFNFNSRTITAPLAAFTMATLLFVYSRTSIQAAKRNAQKHREADGGQINWNNESLRRHGLKEGVEGTKGGVVGELLTAVRTGEVGDGTETKKGKGSVKDVAGKVVEREIEMAETPEEKRIRERRAR